MRRMNLKNLAMRRPIQSTCPANVSVVRLVLTGFSAFGIYLFIYLKASILAPSTAQGHLRAFQLTSSNLTVTVTHGTHDEHNCIHVVMYTTTDIKMF